MISVTMGKWLNTAGDFHDDSHVCVCEAWHGTLATKLSTCIVDVTINLGSVYTT